MDNLKLITTEPIYENIKASVPLETVGTSKGVSKMDTIIKAAVPWVQVDTPIPIITVGDTTVKLDTSINKTSVDGVTNPSKEDWVNGILNYGMQILTRTEVGQKMEEQAKIAAEKNIVFTAWSEFKNFVARYWLWFAAGLGLLIILKLRIIR